MNITSRLLARRGNLPRPVIDLNFGNASKIQEGATAVDVAGWTGEDLRAGITPLDVTQTTAAAQTVFSTDHVVFDGSDYLEGVPEQTGDFTYLLKINTSSSANQILIGDTVDNDQYIALLGGSQLQYRAAGVGPSAVTFVYGDGVDHVIAITRLGTLISFYIDGAFISSTTVSQAFSGKLLGTRAGLDLEFDGKMYNTLIYPTALTAAEVAAKTASLN